MRRLQVGPARQQFQAQPGGQRRRQGRGRLRLQVSQRRGVGAQQRTQGFAFAPDLAPQQRRLLDDGGEHD